MNNEQTNEPEQQQQQQNHDRKPYGQWTYAKNASQHFDCCEK